MRRVVPGRLHQAVPVAQDHHLLTQAVSSAQDCARRPSTLATLKMLAVYNFIKNNSVSKK